LKNIITLLVLFSSIACFAQIVINVDAPTFKKLMDENNSVIIDLRTNAEIEKKGMINWAVRINFLSKDVEQTIAKLDKN